MAVRGAAHFKSVRRHEVESAAKACGVLRYYQAPDGPASWSKGLRALERKHNKLDMTAQAGPQLMVARASADASQAPLIGCAVLGGCASVQVLPEDRERLLREPLEFFCSTRVSDVSKARRRLAPPGRRLQMCMW